MSDDKSELEKLIETDVAVEQGKRDTKAVERLQDALDEADSYVRVEGDQLTGQLIEVYDDTAIIETWNEIERVPTRYVEVLKIE